jgi:hypothetical protein
MKRAAVIVLNYNMPEAADKWVYAIKERVTYPHDIIVVDNGSDKAEPSQYTSVRVEQNTRTTGGLRLGIEYADMRGLIEYGERPFYYWTLSTSTELDYCKGDPLATLIEALENVPNAVAISPAFTGHLTSWTHKIYEWNGSEDVKQIPTVPDAVLMSRWYHEIGGFEQRLTHSWGLEHDMAFHLMETGGVSLLHNGVRIKVNEFVGYKMDRMDMSREERDADARAEMDRILTEKWGSLWTQVRERESYDGIIRCDGN